MSAWLSFIGGYAKGANEQIDEQRKKEDQYIQDRMKMVAATRLQKQKEAETQRAELKDSLGKLSSYENFNAASKDERVALLGNPMLREQWLKDPTKPVSSVITPDVNKTGKFANEQALIDSVQAKPSAVNDQTFAAFQQPRRSFGARVGTDMEGLKQNAARFGLKPEDLGWEQGGVELPDGTGFGTIKNKALAPDDIDGRMKRSESAILEATDMSNSTDPAIKAKGDAALEGLWKEHLQYKTMQKALDGTDPKTVKHILDELVIRARGEVNDKKKKAIEAEIVEVKRLMNLGDRVPGEGKDKEPKFGELMRTANGAKAAEQRAEMGTNAQYNNGKPVFEPTPEGPALRFNVSINKTLQDQIEEVGKRGVLKVIREHTDSEGRVTSMAARNVLLSNGIDPEYFVKERQSQAAARQQSGGAPTAPTPQANPVGKTTAPPVSKLKENVHTTFSNGQVWTLKNGVATKVK